MGSLRDLKLLLPSFRSQYKSLYLASGVSRQSLFNFRNLVSVQVSVEAKFVEMPHEDSYRFITNFGTKDNIKCQVNRGKLGKKSQNSLKTVRHKIVQHEITSGRFLKLSQSSNTSLFKPREIQCLLKNETI